MRKSVSGFTIVELLIVIVVIAILAAISIVAYNGIQDRAYNSALLSSIDSYKKAVTLYAADKGYYPTVFPACLSGRATLGSSNNQCSTSSASHTIKSGFDSAVAEYMSQRPSPEARVLNVTVSSVVYQYLSTGQYNTYGGKPSLYYFIPKASDCPKDGSQVAPWSVQDGVACLYIFPDL